MRRTLICLTIALAVALCGASAWASDTTYKPTFGVSVGVNASAQPAGIMVGFELYRVDQTAWRQAMASRCPEDVWQRLSKPVGMVSFASPVMPIILDAFVVKVKVGLPGINSTKDVHVSLDKWKTFYEARWVEGDGWVAWIPVLKPGVYYVDVTVWARDVRLDYQVVVPVGRGSRERNVTNAATFMVQKSPEGVERMSDDMLIACMQGVIPLQASVPMSYYGQKMAEAQMAAQLSGGQTARPPADSVSRDKEPAKTIFPPGTYTLYLANGGSRVDKMPFTLAKPLSVGDTLAFRVHGQSVETTAFATASVDDRPEQGADPRGIYATMLTGVGSDVRGADPYIRRNEESK